MQTSPSIKSRDDAIDFLVEFALGNQDPRGVIDDIHAAILIAVAAQERETVKCLHKGGWLKKADPDED